MKTKTANKVPEVKVPLADYQALLARGKALEEERMQWLLERQRLLDLNQQYVWEIYDLKRRLWSPKSEKRLPRDPSQLNICWETPVDSAPVETVREKARGEVEKEEKNYLHDRDGFKKKKHKGNIRKPFPLDIPRRQEILDPAGDLSSCRHIGQEITEKLEIEKNVYVRQIIRNKYKTPDGRILIAPLPVQAIAHAKAGASVLSHIAVGKYGDHLPLYRQIDIFSRIGLHLPASTVSDWCLSTAQELEPIYNELREKVRSSRYVIADETPYKVQGSDRKGSLHQGYMWNFYCPEVKSPFFEYHKGRGASCIGLLLEGGKAVQSDGYQAYDIFDDLPGYLHLCCWAHARRKFKEAENSDPPRAGEILSLIGKLYKTESEIREKELEGNAKTAYRQAEAYPVLQEIEAWIKSNIGQVKSGSPMDKAMQYTYARMEQLSLYVTNADFHIDSNAVERSIRPLTLNRKNTLFSGSHEAAHAAAIFFTLIGCCKENNVNPEKWMQDALIRVKDERLAVANDYSSLLPFNWKEA